MSIRKRLSSCVILVLSCALVQSAAGDVIKLKSGGEIRGKIDAKASDKKGETIAIRTLTGALVVIPMEDVEFVTERKIAIEEYETRLKRISDTLDGHWEMANWCRKRHLKEQRADHLRRVIDFDPEHRAAHYGLGHTQNKGRWMSREDRDAMMKKQGYVRYKNRYITLQEMQLIEKSDTELAAEREWFKKVRTWHGWLSGRSVRRQEEGVKNLQSIRSPDAVAALKNYLGEDKNTKVRSLYVHSLGQIGTEKTISPLVAVSLFDVDNGLRVQALDLIDEDMKHKAIGYYVKNLKSKQNYVVNRAAVALGRFGNADVVPALIVALVTSHRYEVTVPGSDSPTYSFSNNGSVGLGGGGNSQYQLPPEIALGLLTGQYPNGVIVHRPRSLSEQHMKKTIIVKYEHYNTAVRAALKKLTDKDLGYDERSWRLWWAAEKNGVGKVPVID